MGVIPVVIHLLLTIAVVMVKCELRNVTTFYKSGAKGQLNCNQEVLAQTLACLQILGCEVLLTFFVLFLNHL